MLFMSCVVMLSRPFIAALCSPAAKGLAYWLLFVMFNCVFVNIPCGILGQVWYLIVSIPGLCRRCQFQIKSEKKIANTLVCIVTTSRENRMKKRTLSQFFAFLINAAALCFK